eukprot:3747691-Rhodomonas_salina.1
MGSEGDEERVVEGVGVGGGERGGWEVGDEGPVEDDSTEACIEEHSRRAVWMAWAWSVPQTLRSQSHSWLTRPRMSGLMAEH